MRLTTVYTMADPPTGKANNAEMVGYLAREFKKVERAVGSGAVAVPGAPQEDSSGKPGEIRFDDDHLYICVAPNTWKRAAFDAWEP
jgi:hypothetical protein